MDTLKIRFKYPPKRKLLHTKAEYLNNKIVYGTLQILLR
jgi:hypothetical protein